MIHPSLAEHYAQLTLGLLLDETAPPAALATSEWNFLARVAERNGVLVRLADRVAKLGVTPPLGFLQAADRERERARMALDALQEIHAACARHQIRWLLPKAVSRFPDVGDDLDILVLESASTVDGLMLEGLVVTPRRRTLAHRLTGSTVYLTASGVVVDIHHARLGSAGQHNRFPAVLVRNRCPATIGGMEFLVPCSEDQLVLQGVEKVVGRRFIALADVLQTIVMVRQGTLDWDYIARTAWEHDAEAGLCCYLHYVDEIHARLVGRRLVTREALQALGGGLWGRTRFAESGLRFPALWVTARIHTRQFARALGAWDWRTAARVSAWAPAVIAGRL
jgi:hypothetical protein